MQNRIRVLRTEHQWSQAQLAERLGVSRQTINALEVGKYDPSLPLALKIAQLFNTPIEAIFSPEEGTMFAQQSPFNFPNLPDAPLFHRFTPRAVKVIKLAQSEARRLGHNFVGTEQILLGLIEEGTGVAAQVLKAAGVQHRPTRIEVEKIIGRGNRILSIGMPFTHRAKSLLICAAQSASELGHFYIDTENLLLGLLRGNKQDRLEGKGEGVAVLVIKQLGVDLEVLEQQLLQVYPRGADLGIAAQIESQINSNKQATSLVEYSKNSTTDFVYAEISARFCALLFAWIEPRKLGRVIGDRTEFHLPDGEVLTPRIAFVAAERLKRVPRIYPELAPDMFVEIKSAFDQLPRLQEKVQQAIALGVKVGLLIDPDEQTVTIYCPDGTVTTLRDRDVLTVPELLPGWELPVSNLWSPMF
ncbi:Clp protease N-terminal domain-containing protein [Microseira sp. BLCC-F43]|jgi:DNA-binding XRE family transcriptional regulator/Uma2 family endonuclease|uniref:Clp protease N-terminal domain-containing protein n=1 Tax=Microseira sp. BLCC-F43 TaxID=3153602 RepID=UPI0035B994ED